MPSGVRALRVLCVAAAKPRLMGFLTMPVQNAEIAAMFDQAAELLEIQGENQFRVRAYRRAARVIEGLPQSVRSLLSAGRDLSELPGIGKDLAGKIGDIVKTGHFVALGDVDRGCGGPAQLTLPERLNVEPRTAEGEPPRVSIKVLKQAIDSRRRLVNGRQGAAAAAFSAFTGSLVAVSAMCRSSCWHWKPRAHTPKKVQAR
jgi:Helix-hairpin-helix domain